MANFGSLAARAVCTPVAQAVGSAPLAQNFLPSVTTSVYPSIADRLLRYGPRSATARFHEYSTSLEVSASPFENLTSCLRLTVYVRPSAEIPPLVKLGTLLAMSGTILRLLS